MVRNRFLAFVFASCLVGFFVIDGKCADENACVPGAVELDPPTTVALGVSTIINGDANMNAAATLEYRKFTADNSEPWKFAQNLLRAEDGNAPANIKSPQSYFFKVDAPKGSWRFAGSVWDLTPDTVYELRVKVKDPDGGEKETVYKARTRAEPARIGTGRQLYVVPQGPEGDGSKEKPFAGLVVAQKAAQPGDTFFLLPGVYKGTFTVTVGGQEGKPIIWRAARLGDGRKLDENGNPEEVVIDPNGKLAIALGADCVTFDGLTIRNAATGMEGNGRGDITVRFCRFFVSDQGIKAQHPREHAVENFYIADNIIEGPRSWPREKMDGTGGIDLSGSGHVVCRNRIRGFSDGFSTCRAPKTFAIDLYENDIYDCVDDGIETDYSDYNVRVYRNRLTNVYQAISGQPVRGGPVFIFRNIIYNVAGHAEIFKMHNYTSGLFFAHNTTFKKGTAFHCGTPEPARNVQFFNNLFVGAGEGKGLAINFGQTMINSQFDYNGVVGEGFSGYIRWSKGDWLSENQVKESGPVQRNGVLIKGKGGDLFATSLQVPEDDKTAYPPKMNDPRLKEDAVVIDKGVVLPGINDDFKGKAPDLGAHEFGTDLPHYGPRPDPELENIDGQKKVE